jgi:Tectonin domain/Propeller
VGTITWIQVTSPVFLRIAVGQNGDVWALGPGIFYRVGITPTNLQGTGWQLVSGGLVDITVCPNGDVWGTNTQNQIWYAPKPTTLGQINWSMIDGFALQIYSGANGAIWCVNTAGNIFYRTGITTTNPKGISWQMCNGSATNIAVCPNGDVWAINAGQAMYAKAPTVAGQLTWINITSSALLKQLSISPNGDVWAMANDGTIYNRTGITSTMPQGSGWQLYNNSFAWLSVGYKATEGFTLSNMSTSFTLKNTIILLIILLIIYGAYIYIKN